MWALGLMSGTSMDGVDAALIETDGHRIQAFGPCCTVPYEAAFRGKLRAVLGGAGDVLSVGAELTQIHADVVGRLLQAHRMAPSSVDLIGFHGHTILHQPEQRRTWQMGDGALLASLTGIDVICDFRTADVTAGGQGAPLVPVYHAALAAELLRPVAIVNIGGVANITWIGPEWELLAFDTGPGNAMIDDWVQRHTGQTMDQDGALAGRGQVNQPILAQLLASPYFDRPPPKSLDRDEFSTALGAKLSTVDGAATLTAFTALSIARAVKHLPHVPQRWLVCGGGRHNPVLMAKLSTALGQLVEPVEVEGWRGDTLEAEAFAFMAVRSRQGLPISFPGTTGAPASLSGGRYYPTR